MKFDTSKNITKNVERGLSHLKAMQSSSP